MSDDDRRGSLRVPIELKVEYKKLNTFFADYTKNISKGGTFIRTARPLPVGTRFVFALSVPALSEPVSLQGEVAWILAPDLAKTDDEPGMGIRFVFDSDGERVQFEDLVERMMVESLGKDVTERLLRG